MGLFDFLKPKQTEVPKELGELYKHIFSGGQKQIENGAREIMELSKGKLDLKESINIFTKARMKMSSDLSDYEYVKEIITDSGNKLTYLEAASIFKFVVFVETKREKEPGIMEYLVAGFATNTDGIDADELPNGRGEFGYDANNPIPVKGIITNEFYLSQIRTNAGEEIKWERIGSFHTDACNYPVDAYNIFNLSGKNIATLYISPYHKRISNKATVDFYLSRN